MLAAVAPMCSTIVEPARSNASRLLHIDSHFEFAIGAFFQFPAFNITKEGFRQPFQIAPNVTVAAGSDTNYEWGFAHNSYLSAPLSLQGRLDVGGFHSGHRLDGAGSLNYRSGDRYAMSFRYNYYDVSLREGGYFALGAAAVVCVHAAYLPAVLASA